MTDEQRLKTVQEAIKYTFKDPELLARALRHSSYVNEHSMTHLDCNERLEFLGDSVLEIAISWMLYDTYPDLPEGELTKMRAGLVCEPALADDARKLGIGDWLQLGKGEEKTGGREKDSLLSDAMEALIGAVFVDGGSRAVNAFIYRYISFDIEGQGFFRDRKTELQERLQGSGRTEIRYVTEELSHDDQENAYLSKVYSEKHCIGQGTGRSKKAAQQNAAHNALLLMKQQEQGTADREGVCRPEEETK